MTTKKTTMKTTRYPAKERRALLLEQRKRKEALEKLEICKRAYENKFSKSFDADAAAAGLGICGALANPVVDQDGFIVFEPKYTTCLSICRELQRHVGERGVWGYTYSKKLGDPCTRAGYQSRQRLLRLAIRHYRAVSKGKPGLLRQYLTSTSKG